MDISGLVGRPNNKRLNRVRCFDADAWQDTWGRGRCSSAGISAQHRLYMAVQGQGQCWDKVMVKGGKGKGNRETGRRRNAGMACCSCCCVVGCACPTVRAAVAWSVDW